MSNIPSPIDEESLDQNSVELVVDVDDGSPRCEKCGAPIASTGSFICRHCGWYASIGSYVEIDKQWEVESDPEMAGEVLPEPEEEFQMPDWAWITIGCVGTVVAESIAARLLTEAESLERTAWSVTQLFVGLGVVGIVHFVAFVLLMRDDSEASLLDFALRPLKIWICRFHELPKAQWLTHLLASGLTAVVMATLVIGGIPYERLLDWGTKAPVKKDLMGAIASQAQKLEGDDESLEEAVQDFAGKQDLTNQDGKKKKVVKKDEATERQEDDCVIIGYRTNSEGLLYQLVLAGENYGKLQHVGQVRPQLSVKELRKLGNQLEQYKRFDPFVKVQMEDVHWVEPVIACRISYARKGKKGGLYETKLEEILGKIDVLSKNEKATTDEEQKTVEEKIFQDIEE